jgi:hypothetical protein
VLVVVELIDDDEAVAARLQIARDLAPNPAEAADQVVAGEVFDLVQGAALLEDLAQVPATKNSVTVTRA